MLRREVVLFNRVINKEVPFEKILKTMKRLFIPIKLRKSIRVLQVSGRALPDVQAGFRKARGTRDQMANIRWIMENARVPEKYLFLLYGLCQSL